MSRCAAEVKSVLLQAVYDLMTSFIINDHTKRAVPKSWSALCPFCKIIKGELNAWRVYEDDSVIIILDILPLRKGHLLVIPKTHCSKVSELPVEYAAAVGVAVSRVANALTQALNNSGLNVVCNQEYAQAVPHVHYHVIPAPVLDSPSTTSAPSLGRSTPLSSKEMHKAEFEAREELDEEDAEELVKMIKAKL